MALKLYPVPGKEKSRLICAAFAAGAPKNATGSVFFGTEGQMSAFQKAKAGSEPWYYIDNSYFDKHRGLYFRVTKNALQVDPRGQGSEGQRFAALKVPIKAWRDPLNEEVLIAPQSDDFMKSTLGRKDNWVVETAAQLNAWGMRGVRIRPWNRDKLKAAVMFADDLPNLRLVVVHSSAAAITALLEGVPAISTGDTAAAHWIGGPFTRENVLNPVRPSYDERLWFAEVLADNQFTLEEFKTGKAWAWLNNAR